MSTSVNELLRGVGWCQDGRVLRADPADRDRLPGDTWERATVPAGVRLEFVARGARAVEIEYAASEPLPADAYRRLTPAFTLLRGSEVIAECGAEPTGRRVVRLELPAGGDALGVAAEGVRPAGGGACAPGAPGGPGRTVGPAGRDPGGAVLGGPDPDGRALGGPDQGGRVPGSPAPGGLVAPAGPEAVFTLHLPEVLRPVLYEVRPLGGTLSPAPARPRWLVYGDSISEGWTASRPHLAWPAVAGRALGLDTVNLGYAGAARGELASAQQVAGLPGDLITLAFGTNCWSRTPCSAPLLYETTRAFLTLVRQSHPDTPLLVLSPVVRPDAEDSPNALGATLSDLREAMERATNDARAADKHLALLPGGPLLGAEHLADGVHPDDAGHARMAAAVTSAVRGAFGPPGG
ncbi:GDSL-type esterase/lipase family protein [Streptomyces sp. NBC_01304]|uniref:GDSL-type esterase/lipase family protein n=1 Tax=Streptomyces sp. NBC_01304 TaxID=2903818 RepID=UPI002E165F8E|nr:GDSL-type esterase/lipase family protein [Streptomyces sp. NBC_01304]